MDDERSSMSRVAEALKRANAIQPSPAPTEHWRGLVLLNPEEDRTGPPGPSQPPEPPNRFAEPDKAHPLRLVQAICAGAAGKLLNACGLKARTLLRQPWVRRLLRSAGIPLGGPAPACRRLTRQGQPCRGRAMANGLCPPHGGSRSGILAERTRSLLERISAAR